MKAKDIKVGWHYIAKVSGKLTELVVLEKVERFPPNRPNGIDAWRCRNITTGREVLVKSCQRFRRMVADPKRAPYLSAITNGIARVDGPSR